MTTKYATWSSKPVYATLHIGCCSNENDMIPLTTESQSSSFSSARILKCQLYLLKQSPYYWLLIIQDRASWSLGKTDLIIKEAPLLGKKIKNQCWIKVNQWSHITAYRWNN